MTARPAAVFQQITGITTITCYAPALLSHAGFGGFLDGRPSQTVAVMAVLRSVISSRAPPGRNRMFVIAPGLEAVPGTDRLKQTGTAE